MKTVQILIAILPFAFSISAQRIAILQPDPAAAVDGFASGVRSHLISNFRVLDDQLAEAAYRSVTVAEPFNLSTAEAKKIGIVIGSDSFVVLRSNVQRRAEAGGQPYFEGFAVVYVVASSSGSLIFWTLESVRGSNETEAREKLIAAAPKLADQIAAALRTKQPSPARDPKFIEVPAEGSLLAKGLRTPVPYRRMRPAYTELAGNYGVRATIDIEVDVDADGTIARTSIERWAGFGLEESVEQTVRSMNWRPAEREGKSLPMRILLRYNFTKIEKDEAP
jgi:hypothetical protein